MLTFSKDLLEVDLPEPELNDVKTIATRTTFKRSQTGIVRSYNTPQSNTTRLLSFSGVDKSILSDFQDFVNTTAGVPVSLESDALGTLEGYILGGILTLEYTENFGGNFSIKFKEI